MGWGHTDLPSLLGVFSGLCGVKAMPRSSKKEPITESKAPCTYKRHINIHTCVCVCVCVCVGGGGGGGGGGAGHENRSTVLKQCCKMRSEPAGGGVGRCQVTIILRWPYPHK